jgi:prepilin-type N-terminal cleavage/methylation domain-containing protein
VTKKTYGNNQGQTLIEILIAMGIAGVIVTAMTISVTSAINNANYSKNQSLATQYSQEGMEIVKQMQQVNYQTFNALSGRYCLAQTCSSLTVNGICGKNPGGNNTNCAVNINNNLFIRQVDMLAVGAPLSKCVNSTQATVSVLWTDGKCAMGVYCHSEQLVSCFSNANTAPIP